jgi:hypothetical protein
MLLQVYHKSWERHLVRIYQRVSVSYPRYSSSTLFTAHASRTHVKAPQTDFPVKHDNSSGLTHDSPSERPLRTKSDVPTPKAPKSIEATKPREEHQSRARTDFPHCLDVSRIGTKARRAASKPRRIPPRCPEPWKKPRKHQVGPHGSMPLSPKPSRLGFHRSRLPIPLGWDWLASGTRHGSPLGAVLL